MASPDELDIAKNLLTVGCCERCSLRLLNNLPNELINFSNIDDELIIVKPSELPSKRLKPNPCITCLDILRDDALRKPFDPKFVEQMKQYDCETFTISLTVPDCNLVREYMLGKYIKRKFPEYKSQFALTHKMNRISNAYRLSIQKDLEEVLGKRYEKDSPLQLLVTFAHKDDTDELRTVIQFDQHLYAKQSVCASAKVWGRKSILKSLCRTADEVLQLCHPCPPTIPDGSAYLSKIHTFHSSIYVLGRFVKYAKQLPIFETGEEPSSTNCLGAFLETFFSERFRTTTSDVSFHTNFLPLNEYTVLGLGQAFFCKIFNPKVSKWSFSDLRAMEDDCNKLHAKEGFAVRDLQVVDKDPIKNLHNYKLVCKKHVIVICSVSSADLLQSTMNTINNLAMPIAIQQDVQHCRRFLKTQQKFIVKLVASRIQVVGNDRAFILELEATAGLYLAELFDNGSRPSLEDLIGTKLSVHRVDILEDHAEWPPIVTPNVESFRARHRLPFYLCTDPSDDVDVKEEKPQTNDTGPKESGEPKPSDDVSHADSELFIQTLKKSIMEDLQITKQCADKIQGIGKH